ncbi:hypothetical protein M9458_053888, partial [Cirrhinus mrigala]
VSSLEVRVNYIKPATEMVDVRGDCIEMQTCYVEDVSGWIKIQLWDTLIGKLVSGKSYCIRNVCTRQYAGCLFLTTSRTTEIEEFANVSLPTRVEDFRVDEDPVTIIIGEINAAEITVSRRCRKCQAWQNDLNAKEQYHRCRRCGLLQKCQNYECITKGKVSIGNSFGEEDVTLSNSVLKRYLTDEKLLHLLSDSQDIEEHLLSMEKCKIKMQNNFVVCLEKASTDASAAFIQEEVPAVGSVQKEDGLVPVVTRQVGEESTDGEPSISEDQKVAVGIDVDEDPVDEEVAVAMRVEQEVTGIT